MKLLSPDWISNDFFTETLKCFAAENIQIVLFHMKPRNERYDPVFRKKFSEKLQKENPDFVFSLYFVPMLSDICEKAHIPYIVWCYEYSKDYLLLSKSVFHPCSFIFHPDTFWVEKLQNLGVRQVFYLPAAFYQETDAAKTVSHNPLSNVKQEMAGKQTPEIVMFNSVFMENCKNGLLLLSKLDERNRGFANAAIHGQQNIYGFHFLENILNDTILNHFQDAFPVKHSGENLSSLSETYARQFLYPMVTQKETESVLSLLEQETAFQTAFFTDNPVPSLTHMIQNPVPCHLAERTELYRNCKINLHISPREIPDGISFQAMEILGSGGFLLTNYKKDMAELFEPGKDFVFYESIDDLKEKLLYYLSHEEERQKIAAHAAKKVECGHTLKHRINQIVKQCIRPGN